MTAQPRVPPLPVEHVPILIVGGGPVGLTAALLLARQHIPTVLVERREVILDLPRAFRLHSRTLEVFRTAGIDERLRATIADCGMGAVRGVLAVRRLTDGAGKWLVPPDSPIFEPNALTPTGGAFCPQNLYEALLKNAAAGAGAQLCFGDELVSVYQDDACVTATIQDKAGHQRVIEADYLIAADGASGRVSAELGISRSLEKPSHPAVLEMLALLRVNVLFQADLDGVLDKRDFYMCMVDNDEVKAVLAPHGKGVWALVGAGYDAAGQPLKSYSEEQCLSLIRAAVGKRTLDASIVRQATWHAELWTADHFHLGRAFLAGDAAHIWPPVGGYGANVGIQDAHNLAWKLVAILRGWAGEGLLHTYEDERRPVAMQTTRQAVLRGLTGRVAPDNDVAVGLVDDTTMILGYRYASSAVVGTEPSAALPPRLELDARPGSRAPHVWVGRSGRRISTLDLFQNTFVLLTLSGSHFWRQAARTVSQASNVPIDVFEVGLRADLADLDGSFATNYRMQPHSAVLVRPDGFVAWRRDAPGSDAVGALAHAVGHIVSRPVLIPG